MNSPSANLTKNEVIERTKKGIGWSPDVQRKFNDDEEVVFTALQHIGGGYAMASQRIKDGLNEVCQDLYEKDFIHSVFGQPDESRIHEIIKAYHAKKFMDNLENQLAKKEQPSKQNKTDGKI